MSYAAISAVFIFSVALSAGFPMPMEPSEQTGAVDNSEPGMVPMNVIPESMQPMNEGSQSEQQVGDQVGDQQMPEQPMGMEQQQSDMMVQQQEGGENEQKPQEEQTPAVTEEKQTGDAPQMTGEPGIACDPEKGVEQLEVLCTDDDSPNDCFQVAPVCKPEEVQE